MTAYRTIDYRRDVSLSVTARTDIHCGVKSFEAASLPSDTEVTDVKTIHYLDSYMLVYRTP